MGELDLGRRHDQTGVDHRKGNSNGEQQHETLFHFGTSSIIELRSAVRQTV